MNGKGLDSAKSLQHFAGALRADGYTFAARYIFRHSGFKQRLTSAEAAALHAQGLHVVTVFEDGFPTQPGYFTATQGHADGADGANFAAAAGQPQGTPIYFAADYDADPDEVRDYFEAAQKAVKARGFVAGIYGNGAVCADLKQRGIVSFTWLSQSHGWRGFDTFKPHADIVQSGEYQWRGLDVDGDVSNGRAGGW